MALLRYPCGLLIGLANINACCNRVPPPASGRSHITVAGFSLFALLVSAVALTGSLRSFVATCLAFSGLAFAFGVALLVGLATWDEAAVHNMKLVDPRGRGEEHLLYFPSRIAGHR